MRKVIKSLLPPILFSLYRCFFVKNVTWKGDYLTWQEAKSNATGYDADIIIEKVQDALFKVKIGEACCERDSVIFDEIEYSWPLLTGLLLAAIKFKGKLNVIDFGGSLGSTYYQNKKFLDLLDDVSWNIVEQKNYVEAGNKVFKNKNLRFFRNAQECQGANVLLLSSVLQYIEDPYELLSELLLFDFEYILIDRTPFISHQKDEIKLQIVPPCIYDASYPCWFFSEYKLNSYLSEKGYELLEDFESNDGSVLDCTFKGMIWVKND